MNVLRRLVGTRAPDLRSVVFAGVAVLASCDAAPPPLAPRSVSPHLKPLSGPVPESYVRRTVYVPVYSSIYLGVDIRRNMIDLAATISVRNVSAQHRLVLTSARYYDSAGVAIRDYVQTPSELAPLGTADFVIERSDTSGGPGANFLIDWAGPPEMDEPLIEAVMVGQSGNAGFSFTSRGLTVKKDD